MKNKIANRIAKNSFYGIPKLYNVVYYIGKKKIETIKYNVPLNLARWIKQEQERTNPNKYSIGTIKIEQDA